MNRKKFLNNQPIKPLNKKAKILLFSFVGMGALAIGASFTIASHINNENQNKRRLALGEKNDNIVITDSGCTVTTDRNSYDIGDLIDVQITPDNDHVLANSFELANITLSGAEALPESYRVANGVASFQALAVGNAITLDCSVPAREHDIDLDFPNCFYTIKGDKQTISVDDEYVEIEIHTLNTYDYEFLSDLDTTSFTASNCSVEDVTCDVSTDPTTATIKIKLNSATVTSGDCTVTLDNGPTMLFALDVEVEGCTYEVETAPTVNGKYTCGQEITLSLYPKEKYKLLSDYSSGVDNATIKSYGIETTKNGLEIGTLKINTPATETAATGKVITVNYAAQIPPTPSYNFTFNSSNCTCVVEDKTEPYAFESGTEINVTITPDTQGYSVPSKLTVAGGYVKNGTYKMVEIDDGTPKTVKATATIVIVSDTTITCDAVPNVRYGVTFTGNNCNYRLDDNGKGYLLNDIATITLLPDAGYYLPSYNEGVDPAPFTINNATYVANSYSPDTSEKSLKIKITTAAASTVTLDAVYDTAGATLALSVNGTKCALIPEYTMVHPNSKVKVDIEAAFGWRLPDPNVVPDISDYYTLTGSATVEDYVINEFDNTKGYLLINIAEADVTLTFECVVDMSKTYSIRSLVDGYLFTVTDKDGNPATEFHPTETAYITMEAEPGKMVPVEASDIKLYKTNDGDPTIISNVWSDASINNYVPIGIDNNSKKACKVTFEVTMAADNVSIYFDTTELVYNGTMMYLNFSLTNCSVSIASNKNTEGKYGPYYPGAVVSFYITPDNGYTLYDEDGKLSARLPSGFNAADPEYGIRYNDKTGQFSIQFYTANSYTYTGNVEFIAQPGSKQTCTMTVNCDKNCIVNKNKKSTFEDGVAVGSTQEILIIPADAYCHVYPVNSEDPESQWEQYVSITKGSGTLESYMPNGYGGVVITVIPNEDITISVKAICDNYDGGPRPHEDIAEDGDEKTAAQANSEIIDNWAGIAGKKFYLSGTPKATYNFQDIVDRTGTTIVNQWVHPIKMATKFWNIQEAVKGNQSSADSYVVPTTTFNNRVDDFLTGFYGDQNILGGRPMDLYNSCPTLSNEKEGKTLFERMTTSRTGYDFEYYTASSSTSISTGALKPFVLEVRYFYEMDYAFNGPNVHCKIKVMMQYINGVGAYLMAEYVGDVYGFITLDYTGCIAWAN